MLCWAHIVQIEPQNMLANIFHVFFFYLSHGKKRLVNELPFLAEYETNMAKMMQKNVS